MRIGIINGPNLNLLGQREPEIYGQKGFEAFLADLRADFPNVELLYFQSNAEAELVNTLHQFGASCQGIIFNPAAYTHTSIALADAVKAISIPVIEVHISNVFQRESYRHHSYISPAAQGVISGLGLEAYRLAIRYLEKASVG